jgi:MFS family permease
LQQLVATDLHLGDFELSLVQGLAASLPVALLSIPVGQRIDRANRIRLLFTLLAASVGGTLLTALVHQFLAVVSGAHVGWRRASCALPVAISVVADLAPPERRGRALLGLSLGNMTGAALAFGLAGALLRWHGVGAWRSVHLDFAVAGVLVLGMVACLHEPRGVR